MQIAASLFLFFLEDILQIRPSFGVIHAKTLIDFVRFYCSKSAQGLWSIKKKKKITKLLWATLGFDKFTQIMSPKAKQVGSETRKFDF